MAPLKVTRSIAQCNNTDAVAIIINAANLTRETPLPPTIKDDLVPVAYPSAPPPTKSSPSTIGQGTLQFLLIFQSFQQPLKD